MMLKITRIFLFPILTGILLFGSSCVKDGGEPCPNYLKIVYDYNIEYVDQFHRQVTFLSIFMFDAETGVLIREVKQTQQSFPENYTIQVPEEWLGQSYDIMVWAGLDPDSYTFPDLIPGSSTLEEFQLKVRDYEKQLVERRSELEPLWHGQLSDVTFADTEEKSYTVSLMKDTKRFRVVLQSMSDTISIDVNDFDIRLLSADGWYDHQNRVLDPTDREITYLPYYTANDAESGAIAEMNSLRLMNDGRVNTLRISSKSSGKVILDIPLMKYLNALRLLEFSNLPFQEYLDREDTYSILIFLNYLKDDSEDPGTPGKKGNWLAVQISINEWILRFQDID
ncbi:FimB/Mfa2 family fimbrial subunit [Parabacteroides sp. PF5-9]|uniref:FimB/Mfa2 family fimbrial subunit n=1 Tax=Parabacteroides sp. PF5-9 TaxID=1742404 RepID=UPI00247544B1|nr:FimB/Mfa2 family fimbrial subunit [Parabacteroides sp. PF5-9]MDH6357196.1 hypothetical protein [Parabacteroides sp. PF5-9]